MVGKSLSTLSQVTYCSSMVYNSNRQGGTTYHYNSKNKTTKIIPERPNGYQNTIQMISNVNCWFCLFSNTQFLLHNTCIDLAIILSPWT